MSEEHPDRYATRGDAAGTPHDAMQARETPDETARRALEEAERQLDMLQKKIEEMETERGLPPQPIVPETIHIAWDPEVVSAGQYGEFVLALGNLVRAHGGRGLELLDDSLDQDGAS
ncbi:MAG: hypothetical protein AAGG07_12920 [Planctomycetota bacterium]